MAEPSTEAGQWLTQSEAAARLGWHLERLKAAARRGRLQRRKNNRGEWQVFLPDDRLPGAAQGNGMGETPPAHGSDTGGAVGVAQGAPWAGLVTDLRHENAGLW